MVGIDVGKTMVRPATVVSAIGAAFVFLALPQLYILPEGTRDVALSTFLTVLALPVVYVAVRGGLGRELMRTQVFWVLVGLLVVRVFSLVWSPVPRAGLSSTVLLGQFLVVLLIMSGPLSRDAGARTWALWLYWPWVVVESVVVVVFRLWPAVENAFLHSDVGVFMGPNTLAGLFGAGRNNVVDVHKAGGVFVNGDVAAMFLGLSGLAALAISAMDSCRRASALGIRAVGLAALAAVPFTGSKLGSAFAVTIPLIGVGLVAMNRPLPPAARRRLLTGLGALGVGGFVALLTANPQFLQQCAAAFFGRAEIWQFGAQAFGSHALLGLGYGGWDIEFAPFAVAHGIYTGRPPYRPPPPHNLLLASWTSTGLIGLLLTIGFLAAVALLVVRAYRTVAGDERTFVVFAGGALGWLFLQGMGENTDVFGDIHMIPIVALLIALLLRRATEAVDRS